MKLVLGFWGFRFWVLGFGVWGLGLRIWVLGFGVEDRGGLSCEIGVRVFEFRVWVQV